jgi:ATP-dependent Lon protease
MVHGNDGPNGSDSSDKDAIDETESNTVTIGQEEDDSSEGQCETALKTKQQKVLNLKLNKAQVQQIIREAIKTLVRRCDDDGKEFLNFDENEELLATDDEEYETFLEYVESIYSGDFFTRIPIEDRKRRLKTQFSPEEVRDMNIQLNSIQTLYKETAPSIVDVLKMNSSVSMKQKLLEKIHQYTNSEVLSSDYQNNLKFLMGNIKKDDDEDLQKLEQEIMSAVCSDDFCGDYRRKILKSKMSLEDKVIALKRLEIMDTYQDSDSSEYAKYKNWMDTLLSIPFGEYMQIPRNKDEVETKSYIKKVRNVLDKRLSFLENPKDQIINIVARMIRNPDCPINAICLWGAKGTGKTSIVKSISEALDRPYKVISLGGESDASMLTGHGFTYVGSSPGRLIEILRETKCMNPIVLIDELDKVSQTHHGKEIIGNLIHLTDSTTNARYNYDRYFSGIDFDLSKVLFIFTYNDPTKIDKILADRLFKIKVENYSMQQKLEITKTHLINDILNQYSFTVKDIVFAEDAIHHIVHSSKSDEGMRDIKRKFEVVISRINMLLLTEESGNIVKLRYKELHPHFKTLPVRVTKQQIDIFLLDSINESRPNDGPPPFMYI